MINRPKGEETIGNEMQYLWDRSQDPFSSCALSSIPSSAGENASPSQKNGKKAVSGISLSSAFPRKKARTFVLTFEKLGEPSGNTLTKQKMT